MLSFFLCLWHFEQGNSLLESILFHELVLNLPPRFEPWYWLAYLLVLWRTLKLCWGKGLVVDVLMCGISLLPPFLAFSITFGSIMVTRAALIQHSGANIYVLMVLSGLLWPFRFVQLWGIIGIARAIGSGSAL